MEKFGSYQGRADHGEGCPQCQGHSFQSLCSMGPLKLHLCAHSHLPLASSKCLILWLTFHHGRAESIRTGLALPFSSRTVGLQRKICLFCSAENRTNTKCGISFVDTGWSLPAMQGYPLTTREERLGRDEAGPGALAKLCELTLSSQTCISCRDTKSSCGRKRESITAVLICLP